MAEAVGFLLAGHEVTAYALTFTTYLLAKNPQVQEKLVGEIEEYLQDQPVGAHTHIHNSNYHI